MKYRLLPLIILFTCVFPICVFAQSPRYARVISANANLRDTPSIASGSEQEVAEGTLVKVLDEKPPWYVVRVGNRVGWMHGNTIEFVGAQDSPSVTPRQQAVVPGYRASPSSIPRRENAPETPARTNSESRGYIRGPRGGCYYISGSGRKVYVDRSLCN